MVSTRIFGKTQDGREVLAFTFTDGPYKATVLNYGGILQSIVVPDRNGAPVDVLLGYNDVAGYENNGGYLGALIGRFGNRIEKGKLVIDGETYQLYCNDRGNHLHGGQKGFNKKIWDHVFEGADGNTLSLSTTAADGEENYPGNLKFTVKFTVENNALLMEYTAVSDKDTLWCPTNHAYFNLDGESRGDCLKNILQINADKYTPVDSGLIPMGEEVTIKSTPFDFTKLKRIGENIESEELKMTLGYDHNYILASDHAAHAKSEITGIKMDVYTDMPCLQFYSGGQLNNVKGKSGVYKQYAGFCLEPQYCPNAINLKGFDLPFLTTGEEKTHYIKYVF